ncbi:MAG: hypothetical protein ACSLEL_01115 [Candidatus Malihini olakiniferum]
MSVVIPTSTLEKNLSLAEICQVDLHLLSSVINNGGIKLPFLNHNCYAGEVLNFTGRILMLTHWHGSGDR